jgi:hypothetical protein
VPAVLGPVLRAGRSVLTCLLFSAVAIVAVPLQHATAPVTVDYRPDLARLTQSARFPVLAPAGLPPSWTPVSSALAVGGANGPGTLTWQLGYMTPSGTLASLEETDARPAGFVARMTNGGTPQPPVHLAGQTWSTRWNAGRAQRSMYRSGLPTVVVTGDASWPDLATLASSLRPADQLRRGRPAGS